jgi:hypothetical protein
MIYYIGSAEGHEYPDLQVGDEVNPRIPHLNEEVISWCKKNDIELVFLSTNAS